MMTSDWTSALDSGKRTCVLALDIEGAFDKVWHQALIAKLKSFGVDGELLRLLENYLTDRDLRVILNGKNSDSYSIGAGVPQGSILGPIMWNIFINDLLHLIPEDRAFADDGTISISYDPKDQDVAMARLNNIIRHISSWGQKWQVSFAPNKTQFMIIEINQHYKPQLQWKSSQATEGN